MARKPPSKETQIKMVRGALKSPKTPKQFLPSLRKRLAKLTAVVLFAVALAAPARAQFIGYTSPQTVQTQALKAVSTPQRVIVPNLGQSVHSVTYLVTGSCAAPVFDIRIEASNDGVNFFAISQDAVDFPFNPVSQMAKSGGITGVGYFPVFAVNLVSFTCPTATISAWYSGTSTTTPTDAAIFQQANVGRQMLWQTVPTNTAIAPLQISTPFENASGSVWILCDAACPANMTITVAALPLVNLSTPIAFTLSAINVGAVTGWQKFDITDSPTNVLQLTVVGGGAGNVNWTAIYNFVPSSSQVNGSVDLKCLDGCFGSITNIGDPCQSPAVPKLSASFQTTSTVTLIAKTTGQTTYVCGYSFTMSGSNSLLAQFKSGTQAVTPCDTTATNLTGQYISTTDGTLIISGSGGYSVFTAPISKDVCIFATGNTPNASGVITYVKR